MKIAAQLYTVRDRLHDRDGLEDVLSRLRAIGYAAVEVAGLDAGAPRFGELLQAKGLVACAAHESLESLRRDLDGIASRCARWGCRYMVVPSLPVEYHSETGFKRFAAESQEIAAALRPHGLALAYHNHASELERFGSRTGLDLLFAAAPPGTLHAELDTYWLQFAGASPAAWIRGLAGRVPLVHLKDMAVAGGHQVQAEVGEGNLDWPAVLAACKEAGTEWLVVEQDQCAGDPLDSLAISYRNLTRLLESTFPQ